MSSRPRPALVNAAIALAVGALAVGALAACAPSSAGPRPATRAATPVARGASVPPDTNVARIFDVGRSVGSSRREIAERLGTPVSTRAEEHPNRHGPGLDSLFRLDYGARIYWVRRPAHADAEFLELVEFSERDQRLPGGVTVNRTTWDQLRTRLGQPINGKRSGDTLMVTYRAPGEGADEYVRFDLVRDVVRRVVWIFYVD